MESSGVEQPHVVEDTPQGCLKKNVTMPAVPRGVEDTLPGAAAWPPKTVLAENHVEGDIARLKTEAKAKAETLGCPEPEAAKEHADSEEKARKMEEKAVPTMEQVDGEAEQRRRAAKKAKREASRAKAKAKREAARAEAEAKSEAGRAKIEAVRAKRKAAWAEAEAQQMKLDAETKAEAEAEAAAKESEVKQRLKRGYVTMPCPKKNGQRAEEVIKRAEGEKESRRKQAEE